MTSSTPLEVPAKKILADGALERLLMRAEAALDALNAPLQDRDRILDAAAHIDLVSPDYRVDRVDARRTAGVVNALRFCLASAVLQQETEWVDRWLALWMRLDTLYTATPIEEDAASLKSWLTMLPQLPEQLQERLCGAKSSTLRALAAKTLHPTELAQQARLFALWRDPKASVWGKAHSALVAAGLVPAWMGPLPTPWPPHIQSADIDAAGRAALAALTERAHRTFFYFNDNDLKAFTKELKALPAAVAVEVALTFLRDSEVARNKSLCSKLMIFLGKNGGSARLCEVMLRRVVQEEGHVRDWLQALQDAVESLTPPARLGFCEAFDRLCVPTLARWVGWGWEKDRCVMTLFALAEAIWLPSVECNRILRDACALPAQTEQEAAKRVALINRALLLMKKASPERRDIGAVLAYTEEALRVDGPRHHWLLLKYVLGLLPEVDRAAAMDALWRLDDLSQDGRKHLFSEWVFDHAPGTLEERFERFLTDPMTRSLMLTPLLVNTKGAFELLSAAAVHRSEAGLGELLQKLLWVRGVLCRFADVGIVIMDRVEGCWHRRGKPKRKAAWWVDMWRFQVTLEEVHALRRYRVSLDRSLPDFWHRALEMVPATHQDPTDDALLDEALSVWRASPERVPTPALVAVLLGMRGAQGLMPELDLIWERAFLCEEGDDTQTLLKVCFLVNPERMCALHLADVKRLSTAPE